MGDRDKWDYDPEYNNFSLDDYWETSRAYKQTKEQEENELRKRIMAIDSLHGWQREFGLALYEDNWKAIEFLESKALHWKPTELGLSMYDLCKKVRNGFTYGKFKVDIDDPTEPEFKPPSGFL